MGKALEGVHTAYQLVGRKGGRREGEKVVSWEMSGPRKSSYGL